MMNDLDTLIFTIVSFVLGIGIVLYGISTFVNKRGAERKQCSQIYMVEGKQAKIYGVIEIFGGGLMLISTLIASSQLKLAMFLAIVGGTLSFAALGLGIRRRLE